MRVTCEQCGKGYTVADHLIPAKGARAQCPKCGHRQLIKKPEAEAPPPVMVPGATASAPADDELGLDLPGAPSAAPQETAMAIQSIAADVEAPKTCEVCGTPISSPFDVAVGMCERCQALAETKETALPPAVQPPAKKTAPAQPEVNVLDQVEVGLPPKPGTGKPGALLATVALAQVPHEMVAAPEKKPRPPPKDIDEWRFRKADGRIVGPFTGAELGDLLDKGEISFDDEVSKGADSYRKFGEYAATLALLRREHARQEEVENKRRARILRGAIAGGVALVAVAALLVFRPAAIFGRPAEKVDDSVRTLVASWRAVLGDVRGPPEEYIRGARERMLEDSPRGYRLAAEDFKRALIRDPGNPEAAVGLVEAIALAFRPEEAAVREGQQMAKRLASVPSAEASRARAHMALTAEGDSAANTAQAEASRARELGGDDPATLVALARANLAGNAPYALDLLGTALAKDRGLRRAMMWRAEAELSLGRLASAAKILRTRIELDPANPECWIALGRARVAAADWPGAMRAFRSALESDPRHFEARLSLAVLTYQTLGDLISAAEMLADLRKAGGAPDEKAQALVQATIVARELGDIAQAVELARAAVQAGAPGASFQLGLSLLAAGDAAGALQAANDPFVDGGRKSDLSARALAQLGKREAALGEFAQAIDLSPQRIEPILRASALFADVDQVPQALTMLRRALDTDPAHRTTHAPAWEQYEGPRALADVRRALVKLLARTDQKELVRGGLGVVDYHLGDKESARGNLAAAGDSSLAGQIYRAQMALDEDRPEEALKAASRAVRLDRLAPVASYLAALALAQLDRRGEARARIREALDADPSFLPAVAREGELMAAAGERDKALERLLKVWRADPEGLVARRGLDGLGY